jgi:uncharacterized membrane protein
VDWLQFVVQWLHVLMGITWFGSAITFNFIVLPAMGKLPLDRQREFAQPLGERSDYVLVRAAMAVIALGILRGTVFGPIKSVDMLTSSYGLTWLLGLVAATLTFLWGTRVLAASIARMNAITPEQAFNPDGSMSPAFATAFGVVKRNGMLEFVGFIAIFTCMILMRFGL